MTKEEENKKVLPDEMAAYANRLFEFTSIYQMETSAKIMSIITSTFQFESVTGTGR